MGKPFDVVLMQLRDTIAQAANTSGLPPSALALVFKDFAAQAESLAEKNIKEYTEGKPDEIDD